MNVTSKIKHILHPIQGEIWCLHRVVRSRSRFPSNRDLEITPEWLEKSIIEHKREGYEFVTIDEIVDDINHKPWDLRKKKRINISFDDGFRDVYENAYPVFKKYHIPFTMYLSSSFPMGECDLWWIQLEQCVQDDVNRFESLMKSLYHSDVNMRDAMHRTTNTQPDYSICRDLSVSWDQLREMVSSGLCTVGAHTMSHPSLIRISKQEAEAELLESKKMIESQLGVKVKHLSYPHSMNNEAIRNLVKQIGYESASLGYGGAVRKGNDVYLLNRRYITQL